MGWLLALDGATDQLSLALCAPQREALTRELPGGALASASLIPAVQALLAEAGLSGGELQGIGFGQGPGAFTSLRVICAVTQGLAYGWQVPVLALDSLLLVAEDAAQAHASADWQVLMDARMGELYSARYRRDASTGLWQTLEPARLEPAASASVRLAQQPPCALAGNAHTLLGPQASPWVTGSSRAQALARLVCSAAQRGAWLDAAEAMPLYVRDKVAQTTAERLAAKAVLA